MSNIQDIKKRLRQANESQAKAIEIAEGVTVEIHPLNLSFTPKVRLVCQRLAKEDFPETDKRKPTPRELEELEAMDFYSAVCPVRPNNMGQYNRARAAAEYWPTISAMSTTFIITDSGAESILGDDVREWHELLFACDKYRKAINAFESKEAAPGNPMPSPEPVANSG